MVLKLVNTSQKCIILGIFILDKVTRLRALLDPPPPQDGVSEFTGRYPLGGCTRENTYTCTNNNTLPIWEVRVLNPNH